MQVTGWEHALWELTIAERSAMDAAGLGGVSVPVLVLRGEEDPLVSDVQARRTAEAFPDAEFLTIPGAGHLPQEERPELFATAVNGFLLRRLPAEEGESGREE